MNFITAFEKKDIESSVKNIIELSALKKIIQLTIFNLLNKVFVLSKKLLHG